MQREPTVSGPGGTRSDLAAVAHALRVDVITREAADALARAAVPCLLLRGAVLVHWLYADGTPRPYVDADLLVPPARVEAARGALESVGYRPFAEEPHFTGAPHAQAWAREADGSQVDLHWSLSGVTAAPEEVWAAVSDGAEPLYVGGRELPVPPTPARALVVALHAAQHEVGKPLRDLERALGVATLEEWREAAALADRLQAMRAFARGLRMLPAGVEVCARLGLPGEAVLAADRAAGPSSVVLGLDRLSRTPGARAKARLLARELLPPAEQLRWQSRLARRGRRGLAVAYALRLGRLARSAPGSVRAWRRAQRGTS